jgi:hypothetical protein
MNLIRQEQSATMRQTTFAHSVLTQIRVLQRGVLILSNNFLTVEKEEQG